MHTPVSSLRKPTGYVIQCKGNTYFTVPKETPTNLLSLPPEGFDRSVYSQSGFSLGLLSLSHGSSKLAEAKWGEMVDAPSCLFKKAQQTHKPFSSSLFIQRPQSCIFSNNHEKCSFLTSNSLPENPFRRTYFEQISLNGMTSRSGEVILYLCLSQTPAGILHLVQGYSA